VPRCVSRPGTPAGEPYFAPFTAYYFKTTAYPFLEGVFLCPLISSISMVLEPS
jgi:hypothetical protein